MSMSSAFSDPQSNVLQMGLSEGMRVGDFGSGTGHYARAAAGIVGYDGRVFAIEVQEDVLKHLKLNTQAPQQRCIEVVWGDFEKIGGTHLRDHSLDAGMLANVLFQVENRDGLLAELKRVLKPGAKLLVVDWAGSHGGMGPSPDALVSESEAERIFIEGGFHKVKGFRGGPHHYALVFTAP